MSVDERPDDAPEVPADEETSLAAQLAAVPDPWQRVRMAAQAAESLRRELNEVAEVLADTVSTLVGRRLDDEVAGSGGAPDGLDDRATDEGTGPTGREPSDPRDSGGPVDPGVSRRGGPSRASAGPQPVPDAPAAASDDSSSTRRHGCRVADAVDPFGIVRTVVPWAVQGALHLPRSVIRQITR